MGQQKAERSAQTRRNCKMLSAFLDIVIWKCSRTNLRTDTGKFLDALHTYIQSTPDLKLWWRRLESTIKRHQVSSRVSTTRGPYLPLWIGDFILLRASGTSKNSSLDIFLRTWLFSIFERARAHTHTHTFYSAHSPPRPLYLWASSSLLQVWEVMDNTLLIRATGVWMSARFFFLHVCWRMCSVMHYICADVQRARERIKRWIEIRSADTHRE
jgi:hypothetical protein